MIASPATPFVPRGARILARLTLPVLLLAATACGGRAASHADHHPGADADHHAAVMARGGMPEGMGVDQHTSTHVFDDLPDGGRIELQRDMDDPEGTARIRAHLQQIAEAFAAGDFRIPGFVHARADVPGTAVMARLRDRIEYVYHELPRGGEVRIRTSDAEAVRAIHEFLAFQRHDHRAGGHDAHSH